MDFEDYCIQGDRADDLYKKKDFDKAEKEYHTMLKTMHGSGEIDSYIVSKITLGLLLTYIKKEEYDKAFEIWVLLKMSFGVFKTLIYQGLPTYSSFSLFLKSSNTSDRPIL